RVRDATRRPSLVGHESATELHAHAEEVEKIPGDAGRFENLSPTFSRKRGLAAALVVQRDVMECANLILPIERVRGSADLLVPTFRRVLLREHNESARVGERQWPQYLRVHRRENRRIRAGREGERENRVAGEHWGAS